MRRYWAVAGLAMIASGGRLGAAPQRIDPKPPSELATLFGPEAYPPLADTLREDGTVIAALAIDPQGAVTACRIATSSNSASLDAATCRIITTRKPNFVPARDAAGKAVAGTYDLKIRWTLPERLGAARRAQIESAWPTGRWFGLDEALAAGLPSPLRKLLLAHTLRTA